ncbi:MAG: site-specific DNA-methyltransferase [Rhodovulum sulfidophilum]|uniref:site-specific DNA-methyltransferase (adenine-specific) n=1 Tax=Rhodovulum sulfidophilum TaxID=35806 RepID=A0A2W5NG90_RHOSU|nr:MAG: site-specific DNA-methyltransferase [Rhodovulum sulfidophilum]
MNKLWYGDNLTIMQGMAKYSVDLIYLDPPFKSDTNYNLLYKNMTGKPVPEQAEAFFDTWTLDANKLEVARAMPVLMREHGVDDYYEDFWRLWMNALRHTQPELMAYLIYMVQRLLYMKTILRPTGSIYLHCDPTASHYIKIMMDAIFGHQNFRNEIIWKRTSAHSGARRYGPVHDVILFYSAGQHYTWNRVAQSYDEKYLDTKYRHNDKRGRYRLSDLTGAGRRAGDSGRPWRGFDPDAGGRHWGVPAAIVRELGGDPSLSTQEKLDLLDGHDFIYMTPGRGGKPGFPQLKRYLEPGSGQPVQDVFSDISPVNSMAEERLGYPTQKPVALLDRIIQASSNKGDIVFDPFCGCGTTIYSAIKNERRWVGCDIAILSVKLIREQLIGDKWRLVERHDFEVDGIPTSVEGAEELFRRDPFQFQHWFVERIGGFPMQKKVADRGIDGRVYFETAEGLREVILSVKGGKLRPTDVRDLRGVMEREGAAMAGFLSLQEPSKAMKVEAAEAGMFEYNGINYPRLQLLTAREVLESKLELHTPTKMGSRIASVQGSLAL